jgi:hypothetical protein
MVKFLGIVCKGAAMNKLFAGAVGLAIIISSCLPVMAESKAHGSPKPARTSTGSDDLNFGDVVNGVSFTGARLVRFTIGLAVGAPVAVLRKSLRQTHDTSKNVVGDHNEACCLLTEAIMLPTVGVFVGGLEGVGWSVGNSWKYAEHKKPFDFKKEMFSLGALDE